MNIAQLIVTLRDILPVVLAGLSLRTGMLAPQHNSVRSRMALALVVLTMGFAVAETACGSRTSKATTAPIGVRIIPFEALPIPAYEGVGTAEMGPKLSLRSARDVAYAQAYRLLSQNIMSLHVNRLTELSGSNNEAWVSPMGTTVSRALLVGKKFTEEVRVGQTLWIRAYMSKAEVDDIMLPSLQQMVVDLTPAIRASLTKDLQGVTPIEEQVRILSEFQRQQGRKDR